jgi:S-DNA-T family DNA segregation ATPase FtsK/SpoIIIE
VDSKEVWSKIKAGAKSVGESATNAADVLSPTFAPFAARWDAEADRRRQLRTPENLKRLMEAQKNHTSARSTAATARTRRQNLAKGGVGLLNAERRAARTADKAARQHARQTLAKLKEAKANYPITLKSLAVRWHAAHTALAGGASYGLSTSADWATWPGLTSAAIIGLHVGGLALGHRDVVVQFEDGLSAEERRLMERLHPSYWVRHAEEQGLERTVTEHPEPTAAGIVCGVRLDGKGRSAKWLASEEDAVRRLLGMKTETRMQITRGTHGDRALIVIRTRSASDGVSMIWTPDHVGIGVDEVTGEFVDLPLKPGTHILLAGITGMGKSVSWRPLVMRAHLDDEWAVIVVDPKRQEAIGWQHCLRCVGQEPNRERRMADIYAMAKELTREMHRRQGIATGSVWVPDGKPENRKLLVVIDEGAAIVRMAKQKQYADVMDLFEELWSEARSVGYQFVWATQFPTKAVGVPAAVKENMSARLSLTVGAGEAERAIFGESAQQEGWLPSKLDGIPGRAMLQHEKRGSDPLRLWHVTDGTIAALPKAKPWISPATEGAKAPTVQAGESARPALRLVKDGTEPDPAPAAEGPEETLSLTNRGRVQLAIQNGARTAKAVADATGMNKGTVSREIKALTDAGVVRKSEDGSLEVSA